MYVYFEVHILLLQVLLHVPLIEACMYVCLYLSIISAPSMHTTFPRLLDTHGTVHVIITCIPVIHVMAFCPGRCWSGCYMYGGELP